MSKEESKVSRRALILSVGGGSVVGALGALAIKTKVDRDGESSEPPENAEPTNSKPTENQPDPQDKIDSGDITDVHGDDPDNFADEDEIRRENEEIEKLPSTGAKPPGE